MAPMVSDPIERVAEVSAGIKPGDNYLLYDGECPFCAAYIKLTRIREAEVDLYLLDARNHPEHIKHHAEQGLHINDGMLLKIGDQVYFGGEVMYVLGMLSSENGLFNRIHYLIFSKRKIAIWIYPVLRFFRNLTLKILGRKPIQLD